MKKFVVSAMSAVVLAGVVASSANAAPIGRHHALTPSERAAIARSTHNLDVLKARVRADGKVTVWERAQVRMAQARHDRLVYRYTHN